MRHLVLLSMLMWGWVTVASAQIPDSVPADHYTRTNGDPNTLQLQGTLYRLFNTYFNDQLGSDKYTSSNALYQDRGVKDGLTSWTVGTDAQVFASFRDANFTHEVYMTDSTGNRLVDAQGHSLFSFAQNSTQNGSQIVNLNTAVGLPVAGDVSWGMNVFYGTLDVTTLEGRTPNMQWSADPTKNIDGILHLVVLNVTDLMQAVYGTEEIQNAYMFAWEDQSGKWYNSGNEWRVASDFDYNDFAYIVTNVKPTNTVTPEPATLLIFGAGLVGLPIVRRFRSRLKKSA